MHNPPPHRLSKIKEAIIIMIDQRIAISHALISVFKGYKRNWEFLSFLDVSDAISKTYNGNYNICQKLFLLNIGGIDLSKGSLENHVINLRQAFPDVPIILFADNEELLNLDLFLYLKLNGFMMTNTAPEVLTAIMSLVIIGEIYIPPTLVSNLHYKVLQKENIASFDEQILTTNRVEALTPRQCNVLELVYYGLSNKVIADRLSISENTVKAHMGAIMKKLRVNNRVQAVNAYINYLSNRVDNDKLTV